MTRGGRFVPSLAYFCPQGGRSGPLNRLSADDRREPNRRGNNFCLLPFLMRAQSVNYLEILPADVELTGVRVRVWHLVMELQLQSFTKMINGESLSILGNERCIKMLRFLYKGRAR